MAMLLNACFVLVTLGQIALNFLIGTLLYSPQIRRRSVTTINLLLVTVLSSVPPALLYVLRIVCGARLATKMEWLGTMPTKYGAPAH